MRWKRTLSALALFGGIAAAGNANSQTFDRDALEARGEVYIVSLHDRLEAAERTCAKMGISSCEKYFEARARAIIGGAEVYSLPFVEPEAAPASSRSALAFAYEETRSLIVSEAADHIPPKVAALQTAYEGWVSCVAADDARGARFWQQRWESAISYFYGDETPGPLAQFDQPHETPI